jgi:hypothetical protein
MTPSTTTPRPGTSPANSRCTKQFWSRPHGLELFLSVGPELLNMAGAWHIASLFPIGCRRSHIWLLTARQRKFIPHGLGWRVNLNMKHCRIHINVTQTDGCSYFLKRQQREILLTKVISPKVSNWSSDLRSQAVSNIDMNSPKNLTSKVFPRYGPLWQILLELWATTASLVVCYGPLLWIWLKAMGQCGRFGYALWAIAQNEAIQ